MAQHVDSHMERQTKGGTPGPKKRIIVSTQTPTPSQLDDALQGSVEPTAAQLFSELKCLLGQHLVALRTTVDTQKAIVCIKAATQAVAQMEQVEQLKEISSKALAKMTDDELKVYAGKMIDKFKN